MATKKPPKDPARQNPARPERQGDVELLDRPITKKPRRYHVVFHNDDYTTMEFVVHVLMKLFHKSETEATAIMLHIHHKGRGIAGTYTRDVAESKATQTVDYAKENGHPLQVTAEPGEEGEDGD